jgi:putative nucleotidyltransferase with HDIG domain
MSAKAEELLVKHIKDEALLAHCREVARLAGLICDELGFPYNFFKKEIVDAALLHDIGKPYGSIASHPQMSHDIIMAEYQYGLTVAYMAGSHHNFQKRPYPTTFSEPEVQDVSTWIRGAQIIALCDKYEAYRTRSHLGPKNAIMACLEEYDFDSDLVGALFKAVMIGGRKSDESENSEKPDVPPSTQ